MTNSFLLFSSQCPVTNSFLLFSLSIRLVLSGTQLFSIQCPMTNSFLLFSSQCPVTNSFLLFSLSIRLVMSGYSVFSKELSGRVVVWMGWGGEEEWGRGGGGIQ